MNKRIAIVALPTLLATCAVQADLVLDYVGYGRGGYETMSVDGSLSWNETSGSEIWWDLRTFEHEWLDVESGYSYLSQCIQIYASIEIGEVYDWEVGDVSGSEVRSGVLQDLYARWVDPYTGGAIGSDTDNAVASAFQVMVWEITHENFDATTKDGLVDEIEITTGAIQWDPDGESEVEEYFWAMYDSLGEGGWQTSDVNGWHNDYAQDQANYQIIPAPAAVFGLALGMAGIVRRRRC